MTQTPPSIGAPLVPTKTLTPFDLRAIAAAHEKRLRRRLRNLKRLGGS